MKSPLVLCLALLSCSPDLATAGNGRISGNVRHRSTMAGVSAHVTVLETGQATTADSTGRYSLLNVLPGTYRVAASAVGYQTITHNAVRVSADESVAIIEDDDWYGPGYLADVAKWLGHRPLAGECRARYYNMATGKGRQLNNERHASLCSTAVRGEGLRALRQAVAKADTFIDMTLWRLCPGRLYRTRHVVGIKGVPGRGGIGTGHRDAFGEPMNLRDWIGEDAALYGR